MIDDIVEEVKNFTVNVKELLKALEAGYDQTFKDDCSHNFSAQTGGHPNDCPACAEPDVLKDAHFDQAHIRLKGRINTTRCKTCGYCQADSTCICVAGRSRFCKAHDE